MGQTRLPEKSSKWIGGIDEAGRGAVIGPLVIAGVTLPETKLEQLASLGVKDSKQLSPEKRRELAEKIQNLSPKWKFAEISPQTIDAAIKSERSNLNQLELHHIAQICIALTPDMVYVDALGSDAQGFETKLKTKTRPKRQQNAWTRKRKPSIDRTSSRKSNLQIIAENKADEKFPIVSAASIFAKVQRDQRIEELKKACGEDFGSGYPSDPITRATLRKWLEQGDLPDFVRKSWGTIQNLRNELSISPNRTLDHWNK